MVKEFTYRGKSLKELQSMPIKEVIKLLPARARRSIKRDFTDQQKRLLKKVREVKGDPRIAIKTHCRDMPIIPEMIGTTFAIYNGKEFISVRIAPEMIGHFLGELTLTRKKVEHSAPGIGATKSSAALSVK